MTVTATFMAFAAIFAAAVVGAFLLVTRLPKCPRCGAGDWVANPHIGPYSAYCRNCLKQVDFSDWKRE